MSTNLQENKQQQQFVQHTLMYKMQMQLYEIEANLYARQMALDQTITIVFS